MFSLRRILRLPTELRIALGATTVLFILNVIWAYTQASWKLDPGSATLAGAIVGLSIVGQQARRGFANLIKSQKNQAELDRVARLHEAELKAAAEELRQRHDRAVLYSAMWAETVAVWKQVVNAESNAALFKLLHDGFQRTGVPLNEGSKMVFHPIHAPVFVANIKSLGLMEASLAADVVAVLSRATGEATTIDTPPILGHAVISKMYGGYAEALKLWRQDLYHVAIRIDAIANGRPDPGSLTATEAERRKGS